MIPWLVLLLVAASAGPMAEHRLDPTGTVVLPDPTVTPGKVATTDLRHICTTKWGKDVRHVTEAMKTAVYLQYGAVKRGTTCCEVDHLIPRELGGADDLKNLWPQHWAEARMKDHVETWAHKQVCAKPPTMLLHDAQWGMANDWYQLYQRMKAQEEAR